MDLHDFKKYSRPSKSIISSSNKDGDEWNKDKKEMKGKAMLDYNTIQVN